MRIRFEFKLQDLWVGVFWKHSTEEWFESGDRFFTCPRLDVWICLIPCIPLHIVKVGDAVLTDYPKYI